MRLTPVHLDQSEFADDLCLVLRRSFIILLKLCRLSLDVKKVFQFMHTFSFSKYPGINHAASLNKLNLTTLIVSAFHKEDLILLISLKKKKVQCQKQDPVALDLTVIPDMMSVHTLVHGICSFLGFCAQSHASHRNVSIPECSVPAEALIMTRFTAVHSCGWMRAGMRAWCWNPWSGDGKENDDLSWRSFTQIRERHAVKQCVGSLDLAGAWKQAEFHTSRYFSAIRLTPAQSPFSPVHGYEERETDGGVKLSGGEIKQQQEEWQS